MTDLVAPTPKHERVLNYINFVNTKKIQKLRDLKMLPSEQLKQPKLRNAANSTPTDPDTSHKGMVDKLRNVNLYRMCKNEEWRKNTTQSSNLDSQNNPAKLQDWQIRFKGLFKDVKRIQTGLNQESSFLQQIEYEKQVLDYELASGSDSSRKKKAFKLKKKSTKKNRVFVNLSTTQTAE